MNRKPQGIISYAGLDVPTLLAGARLMFTNDENQLPRRFAALMPLFPVELIQSMPFVGVAQPGQNVAPGGFSIDPATYHCLLYEQMPRLYVGHNWERNTDPDGHFHGSGIVTVDEAWVTCFPQYQPFQGERLTIYPLGGGAQAAAVPESLYPRAAGFLRQAETALGVTRRCHDYAHYVYQRIRSGQSFDAERFENEYLSDFDLAPVTIAQSDLGRMMQDVSMLKNAREGGEAEGLFTENAKRAEHILQYVPGLYACDVFEDTPVTRHTARLLQPVWEDGFVSDWWLPYGDAAAYAAPDRQTLDMAALCQGFQLAPVYDPLTRGGRYPNRVRVVILREKELRLRTADALNNPAYGSGMSPQGGINKLVYLPGSRELLRQGKLSVEEDHFRCENTAVSPERYRGMIAMASLQETKGRLVDALYRRESVLSEVRDTSPDHDRLHTLMNQPVDTLETQLAGREKAQLSGYDADMDYLRRMGMEREWKPGPKKQKTFRFAPDSLRQASIESGFAMRAACLRYPWEELALPVDEAAADEAARQSSLASENDASADDKENQWLDFSSELNQPLDPVGPAQPPLWLNAADPCYLTADVGGLVLAGEGENAQLISHADEAASPATPASATEPPPKPKKAAKPRKPKSSKKESVAKPAGELVFSDEEMERRQVVLELPEAAAMPVAAPATPQAAFAGKADGEDGMAAAGDAAAVPASSSVTETGTETATPPVAMPATPQAVSAGKADEADTPEAAAVQPPAPEAAASQPEPMPPPKATKTKKSKKANQPLDGQISFLPQE